MAKIDWSQCKVVERGPSKHGTTPVFRNTRTPVSVVFDNLDLGASISDIMDWYHLTEEQVTAVIKFADKH